MTRAHGDPILSAPIIEAAWTLGLAAAAGIPARPRFGSCNYDVTGAKARALWTTFIMAYYAALAPLRTWDRSLAERKRRALALIDLPAPPRVRTPHKLKLAA